MLKDVVRPEKGKPFSIQNPQFKMNTIENTKGKIQELKKEKDLTLILKILFGFDNDRSVSTSLICPKSKTDNFSHQ